MKGYKLNPDKEYVMKIVEGICKCNLFISINDHKVVEK